MPKGMSLHIGLNSVDPAHYNGWTGPLTACEADANDMALLAKSQGFTPAKLLTQKATRSAVVEAIAGAAGKLGDGDTFFLTYSGHGSQLPDQNNDEEEDGLDETWCLYDGEIVDDELYRCYSGFAKGVRVIVLSDSCHSGTVAKDILVEQSVRANGHSTAYRAMPSSIVQSTYLANRDFYDKILKAKAVDPENIACSVLLISGCQDNQLSADGAFNGLFTATLKNVWNGGKFKQGYKRFVRDIVKRMPPDQTPNLFMTGTANKAFSSGRPFTL